MKPDISEIELGPHFITVWLKTSPVQLAEKMYYDFCAEHPDLALIQQDRFGHDQTRYSRRRFTVHKRRRRAIRLCQSNGFRRKQRRTG